MHFKTEKQLFESVMSSSKFKKTFSLNKKKILIEPKGLFGIPDLVMLNVDCVIKPQQLHYAFAFELKLKNWKRAIMQAYRYRSFAERSFVLLDHAYIYPALRQIELFQRSKIGLLSLDLEGNLFKHFVPTINTPYCENLRIKLEKIVINN